MAGMNLVYPVVGSSSGTWGTLLNAALALVEDHDHTSGKGIKVPSAGLRINADLAAADAGTSYAITSLKAIDFAPSAAAGMTSYAGALFVNSADNELYYRTTGGTNVKLTSGTTLNVSIVGGIGGDYASSGALLQYEDSGRRYMLQQQGSPRPWASMAVGDVDIYEKAASITNRIRLKSPSGLAASYDLTFPAALPGSTQLLQVSTGGAITASNVVGNPVTFSDDVTIASGKVIKFPTTTVIVDAVDGVAGSGTFAPSAEEVNSSGGGTYWWALPPLPVGVRILSITFYGNNNSAGISAGALRQAAIGTSGWSNTATASSGSVSGDYNIPVAAINHTVSASLRYRLQMIVPGGGTGSRIFCAAITYDRP